MPPEAKIHSSAMSRLLLFILPALFAAAAALLWEPASEYLGVPGLQQPLQGGDHALTKGFPSLKLNDGRFIPVVCEPGWGVRHYIHDTLIHTHGVIRTDMDRRSPMDWELPMAKEAGRTLTRAL